MVNETAQLVIPALINGQSVLAEKNLARENPTNTSDIVGYVPVNTRDDAIRAIDAAKTAFTAWSLTSIDDRIERMRRASDKVKAATPELAQLLSREHGKPLYDSHGELFITTLWMDNAANMAKEALKDKVQEHNLGKTIQTKDPKGVVAAITPWNYPIILAMTKVVPALLTGNTIVVKPSPYAPLAVSKVLEMVASEFPAGTLNVIHGDTDVGVELTTNPKVAKVAFTGGTQTAKHIMRAAADTIKHLTLELGGNDAAIILPDFDINDESALRRLVISNFLTTGQICMNAKRVYVHRSIYDKFLEKYIEAANKWVRVGDPLDPNVTIGPLNNQAQANYVKGLIDEAEARGAKVVKLGKVITPDLFDKGYFMQPTLIVNANYNDSVVVEEQFGPTVPILPYDEEDQVIALANDSIYGLTSSVWGNEENAIRVARRIQAGTTMINTASLMGLNIGFPFGGVKQSGFGHEFGVEGLLDYVDTHVINIPNSLDLPYIPE